MKRLLLAALAVTALAVLAAAAAGFWLRAEVAAPGPAAESVVVVIDSGLGLNSIAARLEDMGVVSSGLVFRAYARLTGVAQALKAGEYRFEPRATLADVLAKIVAHDTVVRFVTLPEGLTSLQVVGLLEAADGLTGSVGGPIPEGSLLPETYGFDLGESRQAVVGRMTEAQDRELADLWSRRAPDLPLNSPEEAVILASIVEKETGVPEERARVAAVFINRLRLGMRLQSDPTVVYGLEPGGQLGRPLLRRDLEQPTPYNTYVISGLPPGPICHPGRESIAAVLDPLTSNDLYFVANGSGGHAFASTLAEHNRNVARWRRIQRERGER